MGALVAILLGLTLLQVLSYYTSSAPPEVVKALAFTTVSPKSSVKIRYPKKAPAITTKERRQQEVTKANHDNNNNNNKESAIPVELPPVKPPARKLKLPYPIFLASFSKSGTTSTYSAFSCYLGPEYVAHRHTTDRRKGGYPELIGRCIEQNIEAGVPPFDGCGVNRNNETQTVVWTDTAYIGGPKGCYNPNIAAMDAIWEAYPHATLLLVRRNATKWFRSANTRRANFVPKWQNEACIDMPNSQNETEWVQFYEQHTQKVRDFAAKRKGQMTYVEVELESPDTGRILNEQLGLPESCWKHCQSSFVQTECLDLHKKNEHEREIENKGGGGK